MSVLRVFAVILSGAIAVAATILLRDYLPTAGPKDWWGYPALAYIAVGGAWVACIGWAFNIRLVAVPGHLLSVFAPWGYFYPFPLVAIILALLAGATFRSSTRPPTANDSTQVPAA